LVVLDQRTSFGNIACPYLIDKPHPLPNLAGERVAFSFRFIKNYATRAELVTTMTTTEAEVLKSTSITNSDDWEIFTLSNAQVVYEENGKPASLLDAYADTPLKVVGTFAASRGQLKYCML
jgi:hypothetical protein